MPNVFEIAMVWVKPIIPITNASVILDLATFKSGKVGSGNLKKIIRKPFNLYWH